MTIETFTLYKEFIFFTKLKKEFSKSGIGNMDWVNSKLYTCVTKLVNTHMFFGLTNTCNSHTNTDDDNLLDLIESVNSHGRKYIVTNKLTHIK